MERYEEVASLKEVYPQYKIGDESYGGLSIYSWDGKTSIEVGRYCSFAFGVTVILGGNHRTDWVSTYPFTHLWKDAPNIPGHPASHGNVNIGNDVWVGAEALIQSGVTVGDGAVIAARSVVAGIVPPYAIFGGAPARFLGFRFPDPVRQRLLRLKWWDWPRERILKALPLMLDPDTEKFLNEAEAGRL